MARMRYLSNEFLGSTLSSAEPEELAPIFSQIEVPQRDSFPIHVLVKRVSELGGNAIANIFRDGEATGYLGILVQVAKALKVYQDSPQLARLIKFDDVTASYQQREAYSHYQDVQSAVVALENSIVVHVSQTLYQRLSPEKRASFDLAMSDIVSKHGSKGGQLAAGAGGLMLLGSLGGFGSYMALSSLLHTVSFGMLGFGAYTTASTLLSFALGPVGWTALGAYALFALGSPRLSKLLPVVLCVALIRRRHA